MDPANEAKIAQPWRDPASPCSVNAFSCFSEDFDAPMRTSHSLVNT